jgi:TonB family protein
MRAGDALLPEQRSPHLFRLTTVPIRSIRTHHSRATALSARGVRTASISDMKGFPAAMFICSSLLTAQADDHAMNLLKQAIATARTTTTFRAEGTAVGEMTGVGMNIKGQPIHFRAAAESPLRTRRENSGGDHTQRTCDGAEVLYTGGSGFYRSEKQDGCTMRLADLLHVEDNPSAATLVGHDHVQLADGIHNCELIRGDWTGVRNNVAWHAVNTLCIEPERNLILRYESEATAGGTDLHVVEKLTFTAIDLTPPLSAGLFEFSVPTGSIEDEGPQLGIEAPVPVGGVYRIGAGVSYPRVASKVEPTYTKEAEDDSVEGLVLISVVVAPDGTPGDLKIVRGIGHGLDDKAIKAVRQWHFEPGTSGGVPVPVGPIVVAVNFRRP